MVLTSGSRLGPYEIVAPLGAGGMGEVYRARDTRLDRTVAIKVLSERLGADAQFRERFSREARTISQLDHPHICALYDVGVQNGTAYLVMQYLEGETLDSRLERGALPIAEALAVATQIADALDKAHRSGVIHRDLKPGNIFLTRSGAKLLDFGLAKTAGPVVSGSPNSDSTTKKLESTAQGTILGTVQYMAPEQIEGAAADARTDLFAFGAVLYEMLTGTKAFQGKSQPSLMSAILKDDPPPASQVQPLVSPLLDYVVRTCLAKDPGDRFQTAHDLLLQLRWIAEGGSGVGAPAVVVSRRKRRERITEIALGLVVLLWLATLVPAALYFRGQADDRQVQFAVTTPEARNPLLIAISPDGRLLAFVALPPSGSRSVLWLRRLDSVVAQPVAGTEGAFAPFWSPDSQFIAFTADGKLKKVSVAGGSPQSLCSTQGFANGTWSDSGVILFSDGTVLKRVSAAGGEPSVVTQLDAARQETAHRWPYFLPDGRHFLYSTWSLQPDKRAIVIGSLDDPQNGTRLLAAESMAVYAPPGFLIFQRAGTLLAQPFDATRLRLTGEPVRLAEDVANVPRSGRAAFDVSSNGVLVYRTGQSSAPMFTLSWFDRTGKPLGTAGEPGAYNQLRLSADDQRVAVERMDARTGTLDIWTLELATQILTRQSFDPAPDHDPIWSADGRSVVYTTQRSGRFEFLQKATGGTTESKLFDPGGPAKYPDDFSGDGRFLLYHTETVLFALPLTGDRKPITLDQTSFKKDQARFSPDGRWVTYESEESGTVEVYAASFPAFDHRRRLTAHGGAQPQWRADGKELFYLTPDGKLMAVDVKAGASLDFGTPRLLFQTPLTGSTCCLDLYAVTRDGQRFLFPVPQPSAGPARPITVVVNWTAGLKTR